MKIRIAPLAGVLFALVLSCGPGGHDDRELAALALRYASEEGEGPGFEALSASTNHASAEAVPAPLLDPLAGAAYVRPPQIGNYGTVGLIYPVDVPTGRAGMQPAVALSYSSSGGDGIAGIGWGLSTGLGSVSRDTGRGELYYDYRDTFTFNGKRLVRMSGPAESEDGTYRQEIESGFMRFELSGASRGGVWRVFDTNGTVTVYGADASSRIARPDDGTRVYLWSFSRSTDLNGNYMTASYDDDDCGDDGVPYLREIRYTGNESAGLPARQWVRFAFKKRDEAYVSKAAGFTMRMERLLDGVSVGWDAPAGGERELWRYECVYRLSEDSGRPLLETVRSTRHSTEPKFFYREAEHYFLWRGTANPYADDPSVRPDDAHYFEGDFNGDGISDMVFFNRQTGDWKAAEAVPGGGYVSAVYGNRFRGEEIRWLPNGATGDYNGDGRSDIAFYLPRTGDMWVAGHNGRTFDFRCYGKLTLSLDLFACEWFSGDFDGNGLSDAVLFHEPTGRWAFMRNGGGHFDFLTIGRNFKHLFRDDYDPDAYLNSGGTSDTSARGRDRERAHFFSGDFNGDGRTDIAAYDSRSGSWRVGENGRCAGEPGFRLAWHRYGSFDAPKQSLFAHDRFSGDFNGDGLTDIILFDRGEGRWWLGRTGDRSISFEVYSEAPKFREITRWLQGDFNGDGRTDIGFYSATDGKFWIGEASPAGFRYRAYTNLRTCPDPERILAAPLPMDEVNVAEARAVVPGESGTAAVTYEYDSNAHRGKGEQAWAGHFTGGAGIELLVYKRAEGRFHLKKGMESPSPVLENSGFGAEGSRVLEWGRPRRYRGSDGLLYYRPVESVFGGKRHVFSLVRYSGAGFVDEPVAEFGREEVESFDIGASRYWIDRFAPDDTDNYLLVLDDRRDEPGFMLFGKGGAARRVAVAPGALDAAYFKDIRGRSVRILSGFFGEGDRAGLLLADLASGTHRWYRGDFSQGGSAISFTLFAGTPRFPDAGYAGCRVSGDAGARGLTLVSAPEEGPVTVRRLRIEGGAISHLRDYVMPDGAGFRGDFDHEGAPVVYDGGAAKRVVCEASGCRLESPGIEARIARPDLYEKMYPFHWLQGDYNGDGKTDIGFFHLEEREWYFALTQGAVPDVLTKAANGIGGTYEMEYENSSGFDNTGGDGVPDLPVNYRVCVRLTASDGLGRSAVTRYRYRDGCAFSAFVNGVKETDYFGFGEFTALDAYGTAAVARHHAMPYGDFRMNRALAGAVKETLRKGSDGVEYARAEYDYEVRDLTPRPRFDRLTSTLLSAGSASPHPTGEGEGSASSFLVVPAAVRTYARGVLTETRESSVEFEPGRYGLKSRTEAVTDHYEDAVHAPVTVKRYSEYENIEESNEMRLSLKKNLAGSAHETATYCEYDGRGNLVRERTAYTGTGLAPSADRVIEYGYDECGNRVQEKDASGSPARVVEKIYDHALRQFLEEEKAEVGRLDLVTSYERDYAGAFGAVVRKTAPDGNSSYYEYDRLGRLARERADFDSGTETTAEYEYSDLFPLSGKAVQFTGAGGDIETRVFVDGAGRPVHTVRSASTPLGTGASEEAGRRYVKSGPVAYDRAGRVIRRSRPSFAGDEEIDAFVMEWREKDPTVTEYDAIGRAAKIILPKTVDGGPETSISYTYEGAWQVTETHSIGRSKRTVRNGRGLVLYVEESGRGDDGMLVSSMIGFAYDVAGNRVKKMDLASPVDPSSNTPPSPGGGAETSPPGTSSNTPPPPGGGAETSPPGPLSTLESGGMTADIPDGLFRPGVKDSSGANVACWRYDGFGRVKEESDPDRGYAAYEYDPFGAVAARTDALGRVTSYLYDRLGRLTEKLLPDDEGRVRYTYDNYRGSENARGRLARVDDPVQETSISYDRAGRVKEEDRRVKTSLAEPFSRGGGRARTSYRYDLLGRKTAIRYPAASAFEKGIVVTYSYCATGVTSVEAGDGDAVRTIIRSVAYDETGRMTEVRRGNGSVSAYEYDARGRLSRLLTTAEHNGRTWTVQDVSYAFRADDSIAGTENRPDVSAEGACESLIAYSYRYDGLNRLVRAEGRYEKNLLIESGLNPTLSENTKRFDLAYRYAPNGNLNGKSVYDPDTGAEEDRWDYRYDNHAVTGIDTSGAGARFEMRYDAAGNMTLQRDRAKGRAKEMIYDSHNRVRRVTDPDSGETMGRYDYDDSGTRVRKVSRQVVDGEERYVETLSASIYQTIERQKTIDGRPVRGAGSSVSHIYLNGVRVAAIASSGGAYYYLTDQVDSVQVTLDEAGKIVAQHEYLPYGEAWVSGGEEKLAPKYNSQELDRESGHYFYNARHYDPEIGRFVTADTVIDGENSTQGWNRYSYCHNNPILYRDPMGHDARDSIWKVADSIGEKISNVGEEIKSAGEKLAQPLREAGEWLRDKLQGNKESANCRIGKSNNVVRKPAIVDGIEVPMENKYAPHVTSPYGPRSYDNKFHTGVDAVPQKNKDGTWMTRERRRGTPIINLGEGEVKFIGETDGGGKTVVVDHGKGIESIYIHLDKINVKQGQSLNKGGQVGDLGYTGIFKGNGPHVHWEIRKDGQTINPEGTTVEKEVNK